MQQQAAPPPGDPTLGVSSDDEATVIIPSSIEEPKKTLPTVFDINACGSSEVRLENFSSASSTERSIVRIKADHRSRVVVESQSANDQSLPTPDLPPRRGSGIFGNGQSVHSKESLTRYSAKLAVNKKVLHCR